jgi:hypothetical protein
MATLVMAPAPEEDGDNHELKMAPEQCERWDRCPAAICPLAPSEGVHLWKEPVCFYALASGKAGAQERFADDPVFHAVVEALPEVTRRWPDIGNRVAIAARSGFRGAHLIRRREPDSDALALGSAASDGPNPS